jgi:hypothetical protein
MQALWTQGLSRQEEDMRSMWLRLLSEDQET